jgi:hypothetical protein
MTAGVAVNAARSAMPIVFLPENPHFLDIATK